MIGVPWLIIGWVLAPLGLLMLLLVFGVRRAPRGGLPVLGTFVLAFGVLALVTGWLLADKATSESDALRTGGLAAASVVALYGLWLNDRRQRVNERQQDIELARQSLDTQRHDLESQRAENDRARAADERFARAIELLGHDADQVRVGALEALAGLARSHRDYTQTVLNVLCSYLRRPFTHPRYESTKWPAERAAEAERELQARLAAQRLIADLLPRDGDTDAPVYDLDLTGAYLEYFDLSHRRIGKIVLRYAHLFSSNNFSYAVFLGPAWFTEATLASDGRLSGQFRCRNAVFHERAWFSLVRAEGGVIFDGTVFLGRAKFAGAEFVGDVSFQGCRFDLDHEPALVGDVLVSLAHANSLPAGWQVGTNENDPRMGVVTVS